MLDSTAAPQLLKAITLLRYVYPVSIVAYFFTAVLVSICTLQTISLKVKDQCVRRDVILGFMIVLVLEYVAQIIIVIVRTLVQSGWAASEDEIVYLITSILAWGIQVLTLTDTKFPVWYPYYVNWAIGLLFETAIIVVPNILRPPVEVFDCMTVSIQATRLSTFFALIGLYFCLRNSAEHYENDDAERQSLIRKKLTPKPFSSEGSAQNTDGYGTAASQTPENSNAKSVEEDRFTKRQREIRERIEKRLKNDGNWWTYAKGFAVFFPYVWPVHSRALQFRAVLVGCCLLSTNALNVLVPRQFGAVTDALVAGDAKGAWMQVAVYAILTFANSGACIGWLQHWLWLPLQQYSYDALNTAAHSHVMNLSSDFHESKDTSDIHQAVFQGRSITGLVDTICFSVLPMFVDLFLVGGYLFLLFGPYMALDLLVTTLFYIYTTTKLVSMAQGRRRIYITHNMKEWTSAYSSIGNWRVSTYFNNIPYEENRYACNVKNHLESEKTYKFAVRLVSATQGLILALGLLGGCFLAVYQVMNKIRSPGDFVVLLAYWAQLRGPLSFFSNMYKDISESMMDAERLLELFQTKPSIVDAKDARPLKFGKGEIRFENVDYHYDARKLALKNISFTILGGSSVAIVGESGGGKSTILKLINRLYDVTCGSIQIDRKDIREVTLKSLRDKIGVVPQDPTLFNDSIMNNVRYSRLNASDDEVYEACKAAAIHDKIMSFPDGYNSKIGNHGIKLSGGEQQRIAVARAILKRPEIVLLDEATSAVDTETEQMIQSAFRELCEGRTTVTVAHRLSTIMKADHIIVLKNGEIVETGTHDELIRLKGKYYGLWSKQIDVDSIVGRSPSKSPQKRDANIIDDLSPECKAAELAKVPRTTEEIQISRVDSGVQTNKTESPKLKPDAPEFVPRSLHTLARGKNEAWGSGTKQEQKDRIKKEREQTRYREREERRAYHSVARRAAKKAGKRVDRSEDPKELVGDASQSGTVLNSEVRDGSVSATEEKDNNVCIRRPRHSGRRHQSKSEPASRLHESVDGTQDSDMTAISSGEGQPLVISTEQIQRRRVSAPSDPPSTPHNTIVSSQGGRSRRKLHWRMKNRAEEGLESSIASEITSSPSRSSDDSTMPNAPVTSPAEGVQIAGVRFAPGS